MRWKGWHVHLDLAHPSPCWTTNHLCCSILYAFFFWIADFIPPQILRKKISITWSDKWACYVFSPRNPRMYGSEQYYCISNALHSYSTLYANNVHTYDMRCGPQLVNGSCIIFISCIWSSHQSSLMFFITVRIHLCVHSLDIWRMLPSPSIYT